MRTSKFRWALTLVTLLPGLLSLSCGSDATGADTSGDSDLGFDHLPWPNATDGAETEVENPRGDGGTDSPSSPDPTGSVGDPTSGDNSGDPTTDSDVSWEACGKGRCATIQVPVDYADPAKGTLGLRVFVGKARLSSQRGGVLFFNPGGPGAPVVADAADYFALFSSYLPTMDIVLMDNRGMGESAPVDCVPPTFLDTRFGNAAFDWTEAQVNELADVWRDFNAGCLDRMGESVVSNLHSVNVARDMDRVREALGEDKISVWNVSYGTVQASLYGKMFPDHVSAFVLDSPVYFGNATQVDDIHDAIVAYDNELSRFLDWCAVGDACGLGTTPEEVFGSYDALRAVLAEGVAYDGTVVTTAALDGVASSLLMYGEWETLALVLSDAARGNLDLLVQAASGESEDPQADHAMWQSNLVVRVLDYGCPAEYTSSDALQNIHAAIEAHPRMADVYTWHFSICLGWQTQASEPRLETSDLDSDPFLILTSAHDAATPLEGAQNLLAQLNNESTLVVVEKEGHGVIGIDTYGTTRGVDFVQTRNPSPECSGLDCLDLGELPLNTLPSAKRPKAHLPFVKPRPFQPIVRL